MKLYCAICLFTGKNAEEADTVINGQAVCMDHVSCVLDETFSRALAAAEREAKKAS